MQYRCKHIKAFEIVFFLKWESIFKNFLLDVFVVYFVFKNK